MPSMLRLAAVALLAAPSLIHAQTYKRFDKVEAETDLGQPWEKCSVMAAYPGAYDVKCEDFVNHIVYDTRVRRPGRQPVAETAAQPVVEGQWKTGDLVLTSPTALPGSWQLCSYFKPKGGGHDVICAGPQHYIVSDDFIRVDPDFPGADQ